MAAGDTNEPRSDVQEAADEAAGAASGRIFLSYASADGALAEQVLKHLEHAGMLWFKYDPRLKGLRNDPRFAAIVARMGVFG